LYWFDILNTFSSNKVEITQILKGVIMVKTKRITKDAYRHKVRIWNKQGVIVRVSTSSRPSRARALGYKAKQGFVLARVRIKKGGRKRPGTVKGKRPKRAGRVSFTPRQSKQAIAEKRVARNFPNLEVMNSYYIGEDGTKKYYEVILVDTKHPAIKKDKERNWITGQRRRVFRGLTSAAKKSRK